MTTVDQSIFKAYDIRGIAHEQITPLIAYAIGKAYMRIVQPANPMIGVGQDVRSHGAELKRALMKGLRDEGAEIVDLGIISTDMLYFGVGYYSLGGGISVTASHNPPEYNGMKLVREGALPISGETGIEDIRDMVVALIEGGLTLPDEELYDVHSKREVIVDDYLAYLERFVDMQRLRQMTPMTIAFNANHGVAGEVITKCIQKYELPITPVGLYMEPDGSFPQGRPDPMYEQNQKAFAHVIREAHADFGCAWDADADRCFFFDAEGEFVDGYYITAILAQLMLEREPGANIIHDPRLTWATIETVEEHGGVPLINRVGHSFIKARMREMNAIFGGENSGHYYFRDYFFADNGVIPFLLILEKLVRDQLTMKELAAPYRERYFISGELNYRVADPDAIIAAVHKKYSDARITEIDGLSIEYDTWRCNIRKSNTEPLLRLNVEARSREAMERYRDELITIITG